MPVLLKLTDALCQWALTGSGFYDHVYDWDISLNVDEILKFGDKAHLSLPNMGVMFKIETINDQEE